MTIQRCRPHGENVNTCEACLAEDMLAATALGRGPSLEDDLAELEATDPTVRAAAVEYDRVVRRILQKSAGPQGAARPAWHAPRDADP